MSQTIPWACGGWVNRGAAHVSGRMRSFDTRPKHRAHVSASTHALSQLSHRALVVGIPGRSFSKTPRRPSAVMHAFACSLSPIPHGAARAPFLIPLRTQARAHRTRRRRHPLPSACWPSASQCRTPQHTTARGRMGTGAFRACSHAECGRQRPIHNRTSFGDARKCICLAVRARRGGVHVGGAAGGTDGWERRVTRESRVRWGPGVTRA